MYGIATGHQEKCCCTSSGVLLVGSCAEKYFKSQLLRFRHAQRLQLLDKLLPCLWFKLCKVDLLAAQHCLQDLGKQQPQFSVMRLSIGCCR